MADNTPTSITARFFRACLLVLGGVLALWLALELLARFWGWLLLAAGIALVLCAAVAVYRSWWGRRF